MNILRCVRCVLIRIYKVGFISRTIWTDHQENSQLVKVIILRSDRIITMFIRLTSDWKVIIWRWIRKKPFLNLQMEKISQCLLKTRHSANLSNRTFFFFVWNQKLKAKIKVTFQILWGNSSHFPFALTALRSPSLSPQNFLSPINNNEIDFFFSACCKVPKLFKRWNTSWTFVMMNTSRQTNPNEKL